MAYSKGMEKKLVQVLLRYPAAWMLPIATYFVIGPIKSSCCSKTDRRKHLLGFSKHCTIINMILTFAMHVIIFHLFSLVDDFDDDFYIISSVVIVTGLIFNAIYLLLDQSCCFSGSQNCFCVCCCGPECFKTNVNVIDVCQNEFKIVQI